jgi:hypothetical protein
LGYGLDSIRAGRHSAISSLDRQTTLSVGSAFLLVHTAIAVLEALEVRSLSVR